MKIASFPMYDGVTPTSYTDHFWSIFCKNADFEVPFELDRSSTCHDVWTSGSALVLSQSCGYPVVKIYSEYVRIVGTPVYDVNGCSGPYYFSAIVGSTSQRTLEDILREGSVTIAINSFDSFSGWLLLLSAIYDTAYASGVNLQEIVTRIVVTGAHVESMLAVKDGIADIAAIDCVTLALARKHFPHKTEGVEIIGGSSPAPALPIITHKEASDAYVNSLRAALRKALDSDESDACKAALLLRDIDMTGDVSIETYEQAIADHIRRAREVVPGVSDVINGSTESIIASGVVVEYLK